jgi:uncharacterized protein (DUF2141 family)
MRPSHVHRARNVGGPIGRGKSLGFAFALLIVARLLPAQAPAPAGAIEVMITGVRVRQGGELIVALYDRLAGWLKPDSARVVRKLPVGADSVVIVAFDSLPPDSGYAITVIHDRNGNGKMDMRWFPYPKPKEGTGVSQNHTRAGPPEYDKARVPVGDATERITIEMRY